MMWNDSMPMWGDEVGEWWRHRDLALGYGWPSDHTSGGGSSACGLQVTTGDSNHKRETAAKRGLLYDKLAI